MDARSRSMKKQSVPRGKGPEQEKVELRREFPSASPEAAQSMPPVRRKKRPQKQFLVDTARIDATAPKKKGRRNKNKPRRRVYTETPGKLDKKNHITARLLLRVRVESLEGASRNLRVYGLEPTPAGRRKIGPRIRGSVRVRILPRLRPRLARALVQRLSRAVMRYLRPVCRAGMRCLSLRPCTLRIRRCVHRRRRRERGTTRAAARAGGGYRCVRVSVVVCVGAGVGVAVADGGLSGDPDAVDTDNGGDVHALSNNPSDSALSMRATGVSGAVELELDAKAGETVADCRRPRALCPPRPTRFVVSSRLALPRSLHPGARGGWRSNHLAPQMGVRGQRWRRRHAAPAPAPPTLLLIRVRIRVRIRPRVIIAIVVRPHHLRAPPLLPVHTSYHAPPHRPRFSDNESRRVGRRDKKQIKTKRKCSEEVQDGEDKEAVKMRGNGKTHTFSECQGRRRRKRRRGSEEDREGDDGGARVCV
ncbi:hypothetical protein C8J57DRAFT_1227680 [Mycena rebaudengoi]|nr:hypothetical protein C8J57DRAFT_1227680 [Mycena rebaudengoi]